MYFIGRKKLLTDLQTSRMSDQEILPYILSTCVLWGIVRFIGSASPIETTIGEDHALIIIDVCVHFIGIIYTKMMWGNEDGFISSLFPLFFINMIRMLLWLLGIIFVIGFFEGFFHVHIHEYLYLDNIVAKIVVEIVFFFILYINVGTDMASITKGHARIEET